MTDQFQQAFREEALELLAELEAALLELDQNRRDQQIIARAFRALHTIKGSGAMFGYENIANFAHHLEAVFDRLRRGQLEASEALIQLALAAGDHIRSMLKEPEGSEVHAQKRSAYILAELERCTGIAAAEPQPEKSSVISLVNGEYTGASEWLIHFLPRPEVVLNGTNPLLLFQELRSLGELRIKADTLRVPRFIDLNPEFCYLSWDMSLITAAGEDAIRDAFIFLEGECDLRIEARTQRQMLEPVQFPGTPHRETPAPAEGKKENHSSIRVSAQKLDQLVNLVGELVTVQAHQFPD